MSLRVIEVFHSLQGEGAWCGTYATFVRLAGCNLACSFCDTAYAREEAGREITPEQLAALIGDAPFVVWTGGEPLLHQEAIYRTIDLLPDTTHLLETNGTIIPDDPYAFLDITVSPKGEVDWAAWREIKNAVFKFVATGPVADISRLVRAVDIPRSACFVMPLTGPGIDTLAAHRHVADQCTALGLNFSPRLQTLFGWGRGQ